jgi:hypothetical protein
MKNGTSTDTASATPRSDAIEQEVLQRNGIPSKGSVYHRLIALCREFEARLSEIAPKLHASPKPVASRYMLTTIGDGCRQVDAGWAYSDDPTRGEPLYALGEFSAQPCVVVPPTEEEIGRYRDTFRRELDKRMDTKHPSASPSTESHAIALREFVAKRNSER